MSIEAGKRKKRRKLAILNRRLKRLNKRRDPNSTWEVLQELKLEKRIKKLKG